MVRKSDDYLLATGDVISYTCGNWHLCSVEAVLYQVLNKQVPVPVHKAQVQVQVQVPVVQVAVQVPVPNLQVQVPVRVTLCR